MRNGYGKSQEHSNDTQLMFALQLLKDMTDEQKLSCGSTWDGLDKLHFIIMTAY